LIIFRALLAKGCTLEEIDLLWADEEFKNTHAGLHIIHQATPSSIEIVIESKEKGGLEFKESSSMA
jgi:hypothetical protein